MKLNKKQKELILSKIDISLETIDGIEYLYWSAGEASYNIDMKQTWTKEQQIEINEIKTDIKELKTNLNETNCLVKKIAAHLGIK